MKRTRVLQIISGFAVEGPLGGIERFGIELSRNLDSSRFEPILCGLWRYHVPYEQHWVDRLREAGFDAFFAADWNDEHPYRSFFLAWRGVLQHLNSQSVDIVHSHCQFGDLVAILTARPLHAKTILRTVHNEKEWPKRPWRRWLLTNV
ncbi:MAG: glycosyltransferase, partial [bacterium]